MKNPLDPSPLERPAAIAEIERRLAANPILARQLDANGTGTRRQKIEAVLSFVKAKKAELAANKASMSAKLTATRAQVAALTAAKAAKAAPARTAPAPKNLLAQYHAMAPGPAKMAFLREHAVAIQSLSKLSNK